MVGFHDVFYVPPLLSPSLSFPLKVSNYLSTSWRYLNYKNKTLRHKKGKAISGRREI